MNKDNFIIDTSSQLEAETLIMMRTWLRQFFKKHERATPLEVSKEFHDYLSKIYVSNMYRIFHDCEEFKLVKRIGYIENEIWGNSPLFSLHDEIDSTRFQITPTTKPVYKSNQ